MKRLLIIMSLLIHASLAKHKPDPTGSDVGKKFLTLHGGEPLVIARGGFSGLFPESCQSANQMALGTSLPSVTLLCNLQLSKDGVGICLTDLKLDNSTTISSVYPKQQKTYKVNGEDVKGWFAHDYSAEELFTNISLVQNIYSRPSAFDGQFPLSAVEDVMGMKPHKFWLSVQYDSFYTANKLSVVEYLKALTLTGIAYISSPEIGFLKSIGSDATKTKTKLVFEFKAPDAVEPTTNKKYSEILANLGSVMAFASGILVPKEYILNVDSNKYLKPPTTLVSQAHKLGLEVFASGFANDQLVSYNYSYDPSLEYLKFIDNREFSVDGFVTDFPPTASEAIACFSQEKMSSPKIVPTLIISHNGASGDYPGCTDLAYEEAVNGGADIIDCTVQMTKDGVAFCQDSADLMASSTAMPSLMSRASTVPEIQKTNGIFSFDLTWAEIQSLKPQIESPFLTSAGFARNPANKNAGKFMSLNDFLEFAKAKPVSGILINIENAAYLASKKGLGVVDAVKTALTNATFDKQTKQTVMIQSDDSSVLSKFQDVPSYKRVLYIQKEFGDAPKEAVEEIKKVADAVNVKRTSLVSISDGFATAKTKVFDQLHAANISVYVSVLKNEYIAIAFDYFSDPVVELATFIGGIGVDGVVTDFPATANRYLRSTCANLNQDKDYVVLPAEAGALLSVLDKAAQPPASAPLPPLESADVVDAPLPEVSAAAATAGGSPPAEPAKASGVNNVANLAVSLTTLLLVTLISLGN